MIVANFVELSYRYTNLIILLLIIAFEVYLDVSI